MAIYARIDNHTVAEIVSMKNAPETLYHPDLVWVDITDLKNKPEQNYRYQDGEFFPPEAVSVDEMEVARMRLAVEMEAAAQAIAPLQDAMDLDIATKEEAARLAAWKRYRVMLSRVDLSLGQEIVWPTL